MTITVAADITMTANITLPANAGRTLTITSDATARTLTRGFTSGGAGGLLTVSSGASLVLENITLDGDKAAYTDNNSPLVNVNGGGTP
jgi:hypothetical protein